MMMLALQSQTIAAPLTEREKQDVLRETAEESAKNNKSYQRTNERREGILWAIANAYTADEKCSGFFASQIRIDQLLYESGIPAGELKSGYRLFDFYSGELAKANRAIAERGQIACDTIRSMIGENGVLVRGLVRYRP